MTEDELVRGFHFHPYMTAWPYIETVYDYCITGNEGVLQFDGGHFNISEEYLPYKIFYQTFRRKERVYFSGENGGLAFDMYDEELYEVEITSVKKIVDNSTYFDDTDENGVVSSICLFPTIEIKILFRVINKFDNIKDFYKAAYKEYPNIDPIEVEKNMLMRYRPAGKFTKLIESSEEIQKNNGVGQQ